MRCVCEYEHQWARDGKIRYNYKGDEEFIQLDQKFYNIEEDHRFKLYVCPKCGTVRAEKYY